MNPDASSCVWVNNLLAQAWPHLERFGCRFLKTSDFLESQINATTFWRPPMLRASYIKVQGVVLGQVGPAERRRGRRRMAPQGGGASRGCMPAGPGATGPACCPCMAATGSALAAVRGDSRATWSACMPGSCIPCPAACRRVQEPPRVTGIKAFPKQGGLHDEVRAPQSGGRGWQLGGGLLWRIGARAAPAAAAWCPLAGTYRVSRG